MDQPIDLSVAEIRKYMLQNDGKVTNHALVKHFKKFLTNSHTQTEARKRFKTYVTLLSTIKNENNQKFLILRKKYINECPSVEAIEAANTTLEPCSPGDSSLNCEFSPCRPPPELKSTKETMHQDQNENYRDSANKFAEPMQRNEIQPCIDNVDSSTHRSVFGKKPLDEGINAENISRFSFSSGASSDSSATDKVSGAEMGADEAENPISVKEATRKFNRMASEEEAKIISPSAKKKQEKQLIEEKDSTEVTMAHPKAKEWIVSMAKANYQELAKLAGEFPELVKLQDPATGYTALHWAAKHGNEDVVKLIAGTFKADVNSKTNGGYTPLHLATQFGRDNIFELLWNVYKANRDIMDWNGNKPLDYSQQRPSISASTCSSEYQKFFLSTEINNNYRLGGLSSAIPFSTGDSEYSGGTLGSALTRGKKRSQLRCATISGGNSGGNLARSQSLMTHQSQRRFKKQSVQSLFKQQIKDDNLVPGDVTSQSKACNHPSDLSSEEDSGDLRRVSTKRKESFLRKTFRSAAGASRPTKDVVTNPSLKL